MSFPWATLLHLMPQAIHHKKTTQQKLFYLGGTRLPELKDITINLQLRLRCSVECKGQTRERIDVYPNDLQLIKRSNESTANEVTKDLEESLRETLVRVQTEIKEYVTTIKLMLRSMEDGEISVGAYDTAWVALIKNINGNDCPQFPSSLEWIANNQLPDGSWGDRSIFEAHDRLINTLACVVALKTWNVHPDKTQKGIKFINENLCKLEDANAEHMLIAFEIAFPSLIETAKKLDIGIPYDSPALKEIYAKRKAKLSKIPNDVLHTVPTTLLHTIEGMLGLEWEKLLKLQFSDGSFVFSPSATAFALMHTKDENCLRYLSKTVQKFNGGGNRLTLAIVKVDLFEHIWAVDRLERLGISRYFSSEIKDCIDYVERYWTEEGICWARNSRVQDVDDTAMGFRLLRLHGRKVSAEVFQNFKKDGEFFCIAGQSSQALTGTFNLHRASQVLFPGENILEDAKIFSSKFLRDKQANNDLLDKWIISKDLPGEVRYALEVPWYASLPRVEARFYLEQYGGGDDIWIGKTLYRMPYVSNNTYLELARLDYSNCQALHQVEWDSIQKWYVESNLEEYGISQRSLLLAYFLATASIFEPERWKERVAWAKTAVLVETIGAFFETNGFSFELRKSFVTNFMNMRTHVESISERVPEGVEGVRLGQALLKTLNGFMLDVMVVHGRDIFYKLQHAWEMWMMNLQEEGYRHGSETELLVHTLYLCGGYWTKENDPLAHPMYRPLFDVTNRVCLSLCRAQLERQPNKDVSGAEKFEIEWEMQKLVELVLSSSSVEDKNTKQIFMMIAKTYYYRAHVAPATIDYHIAKVVFEKVM